MNRKTFLSFLGLSATGGLFVSADKKNKKTLRTDCSDPITPPVPEGPYYKDEKLNRLNIAEHKKGVPVEYHFKVEDKHCRPVKGAIVDIWQCDADGHYSDFSEENTKGQTWLRGFQKTDANGLCRFTSIFPGWYDGRLTHLHAKVHVNGATVLTTNLFFPKEVEDKVYQHPFYPKGPNPVKILEDIELKVDKDTQRHDTLVMNVAMPADNDGVILAKYTIAVG